MIQFNPDTYQVSYAGDSVQLLPKEFALFRYLYEHAGRSFSREALLDAVWPLEEPVDRTVDDHVYRIRKRLANWAHLLQIETVRGQGYKLVRQAPKTSESPLLQDEQFAADVGRMLSKYHKLGMGAAMQLLSAHRDILSLPGDPFYDSYLPFIRGDFEWLLTTDRIDHWQRLVYAVFIHAAIRLDQRSSSLHYFEKLLAKSDLLPRTWICDLRLNASSLYLEAGLPSMSREMLDVVRQDIVSLDSASFTAILLLKEMFWHLQEDQVDAAAAKLQECEELLAQQPIQREHGAFLVAKGILGYQKGEVESARQALDEGIDTTRQTQFVPHLLSNLQTILLYLGTAGKDESFRLKYKRQWDQLAEQHHFEKLLATTESLLDSSL